MLLSVKIVNNHLPTYFIITDIGAHIFVNNGLYQYYKNLMLFL